MDRGVFKNISPRISHFIGPNFNINIIIYLKFFTTPTGEFIGDLSGLSPSSAKTKKLTGQIFDPGRKFKTAPKSYAKILLAAIWEYMDSEIDFVQDRWPTGTCLICYLQPVVC